jgi:quinol monooxygenase YgiN
MIANHGFNATLTAKPGMGDQLAELLLTGLNKGNPGASEYCVVYLVCRSASNPDMVHITEGWTSEADHHRIFSGEAAQAIVSQIEGMLAKESEYTDYVPVRGKAAF